MCISEVPVILFVLIFPDSFVGLLNEKEEKKTGKRKKEKFISVGNYFRTKDKPVDLKFY